MMFHPNRFWARLEFVPEQSQPRAIWAWALHLSAPTCTAVYRPSSLSLRISRWLLVLFLGGVWLCSALTLDYMRHGILEEMEAGTKVATQMLSGWIEEQRGQDLSRVLPKLGRVRANEIRLWQEQQLLYSSPPSSYKAGRSAPAWFSALVSPTLASTFLTAGALRVEIHPDPSRAVLDAWDDLVSLTLPPVLVMLAALVLVSRQLARELAPVTDIENALAQVQAGQRQTRLPHYPVAELDRLGQGFNRMVERLAHSEQESRDLEREIYAENVARAQLEQARREWSQELHDQLGQNLVAIGSLAQAIINHNGPSPSGQAASLIQSSAQQVHEDLRRLLTRMRPELPRLDSALERLVSQWRNYHPKIACHYHSSANCTALSEAQQVALFRLAQEALTNIARHAQAESVHIELQPGHQGLELRIRDNGIGFDSQQDFPGFGLSGMHTRLQSLGGQCRIHSRPGQGCQILATLPLAEAAGSKG